MGEATNIYPIYEKMMTRSDKEQLLGQRGVMVWFTGLSGSGKSTVALGVERELHKRGILCRILDGDNIRSGINKNLGFSADDRNVYVVDNASRRVLLYDCRTGVFRESKPLPVVAWTSRRCITGISFWRSAL